MTYLFEPPAVVSAPVVGETARFAVHRIYCVGRNYAAHAREMGSDPDRDPPFFFMKPADALVASGQTIPFPQNTANLHYEVELVLAIGKGGRDIPVEAALDHIYAYGVGIDLTRRDRQFEMRDKGRPWDIGKGFDHSAPLAPLHKAADIGHPAGGRIWLSVNGEIKQDADLDQLIWSPAEIVSVLSRSWTLQPGDLIYSGTPDKVGPLQPGDEVCGGFADLTEVTLTLAR